LDEQADPQEPRCAGSRGRSTQAGKVIDALNVSDKAINTGFRTCRNT